MEHRLQFYSLTSTHSLHWIPYFEILPCQERNGQKYKQNYSRLVNSWPAFPSVEFLVVVVVGIQYTGVVGEESANRESKLNPEI